MKKQDNIHIGQLIKDVFDKSGLSVAEFARRIHCDRTNVYKIFKRETIDVDLLVKISKVLKHNFLIDVMKQSNLNKQNNVQLNLNISLENLSTENVVRLSELLKTLKTLKNSKKH